ncbi:activating transcription factor-2 [Anaeramoeba flamelloides]|uniref:Activating transcription factor-2 n=1 Tax=Anaeramoeba flamelloides TaxID=1746091 RepID=A0AAV7ZAV6_9EUKA|nr:activating transcription factor-2 [Anaeramoeba flamelloides]
MDNLFEQSLESDLICYLEDFELFCTENEEEINSLSDDQTRHTRYEKELINLEISPSSQELISNENEKLLSNENSLSFCPDKTEKENENENKNKKENEKEKEESDQNFLEKAIRSRKKIVNDRKRILESSLIKKHEPKKKSRSIRNKPLGCEQNSNKKKVKGRSKLKNSKKAANKRRQKMLERNRINARKSRERKKQYIQGLEQETKELRSKNVQLVDEVSNLINENQSLRDEINQLKSILQGNCQNVFDSDWLKNIKLSNSSQNRTSLELGQTLLYGLAACLPLGKPMKK